MILFWKQSLVIVFLIKNNFILYSLNNILWFLGLNWIKLKCIVKLEIFVLLSVKDKILFLSNINIMGKKLDLKLVKNEKKY